MVTCFQHGVEHVTSFDQMTPESTFTDVDARPRDIVDRTIPNGDAVRHGDLYGRGLFFHPSGAGDEAVLHAAILREIAVFGAGCAVDRRIILHAVSEQRASDGFRVSDKRDTVGPGIVDMTTPDDDVSVVIIDEDGIAAHLIEFGIQDPAVFCSVEQDGAPTICRPVGPEQRFAVLHESSTGMPEHKSFQGDIPHRCCDGTIELEQVGKSYDLDLCLGQVCPDFRHEVQTTGIGIQEPLSRCIQFLEYIFHHPVGGMFRRWPVILPTSFFDQRTVGIFSLHQPVHISPQRLVHGMYVGALRIFPPRHPFRLKGIIEAVLFHVVPQGPGIEDILPGHRIWKSRHALTNSVDV